MQGIPRDQLVSYANCPDEIIDFDCEVRLIDAFVDSLNLEDFGFDTEAVEDGRPKYHAGDLLKIFIYGYMNRIRSSRQLERMTLANRNYGLSNKIVKISVCNWCCVD